jgi:hypothetical protein
MPFDRFLDIGPHGDEIALSLFQHGRLSFGLDGGSMVEAVTAVNG